MKTTTLQSTLDRWQDRFDVLPEGKIKVYTLSPRRYETLADYSVVAIASGPAVILQAKVPALYPPVGQAIYSVVSEGNGTYTFRAGTMGTISAPPTWWVFNRPGCTLNVVRFLAWFYRDLGYRRYRPTLDYLWFDAPIRRN